MTSISSDIATATYAPASVVAASRQTALQAVSQAQAPLPLGQTGAEGYSSQAYQMTLGDAAAAQQSMQTVQAQNHLIEQMNAGVAGDEV